MRKMTRLETAVVWGAILILWGLTIGLVHADNPMPEPAKERTGRYPYKYPAIRADSAGIEKLYLDELTGDALEQIHIEEFTYAAQDVLERNMTTFLTGATPGQALVTETTDNPPKLQFDLDWNRPTGSASDSTCLKTLTRGDQFLIHATATDTYLFGTITEVEPVLTCPAPPWSKSISKSSPMPRRTF